MIFIPKKYYMLESMVFKVITFCNGVIKADIIDPSLGKVSWEFDSTDGEYRELTRLEIRLRKLE